MPEESAQRRLAAILAADVVGYSRLMGVSEAGTLGALKSHRRELVDRKISQHQGRIVKLTGDGMLVEFPSGVNAVACAVEIQREMRERNANVPPEQRIEFRIGVNLGDIIFDDNDIFGDGVNIAARIESIAKPGGVAVSSSVRDNVGNRLDLVFEDMGEQTLKNIERPVRVYHISLGAPTGGSVPAPQLLTGLPAKEKPSIAVLPFNNMSGDPEQEYFADGITEDIITDLSKISGLHVVARNTVFTYKGKPVKVQQAAEELKVKFVLEGSVRKAGQRVRVTGQLIDARDGGHVWADRYDRDLTDIFSIQDEITHNRGPAEGQAAGGTESDRAGAHGNVGAYTYYLRARAVPSTVVPDTRARSLFARAAGSIRSMPALTPAWQLRCNLYGYFGEGFARADLGDLRQTLTLDPAAKRTPHAALPAAASRPKRSPSSASDRPRSNSYEGTTSVLATRSSRVILKGCRALCPGHRNPADDYRSPLMAINALHSLGRHDEGFGFRTLVWSGLSVYSNSTPRIPIPPY
jgi:TolB-like protein/class 3 adenylate cyclase